MACNDPNCACNKGHHDGVTGGAGFALGVAIGAAAAAFLITKDGKKTSKRAKAKFDELTGRVPDDLVESIKDVTQQVLDDVQDAAERGLKKTGRKPRKKKK